MSDKLIKPGAHGALLRKQGKNTEPEEVGGVENRTIPGPGDEIPIRVYRLKGTTGLLACAQEVDAAFEGLDTTTTGK